jgi:uncharacterized protein (TIGR00251 family)
LVRIIIEVKTLSKTEKIEKISDNYYLIHVKAKPKKGKANITILKLLRKHFGVPARILSGHSSRRKIIELKEKTEEHIIK